MRVWGLFLGALALPFLALAEEETSAQRLENAQKGLVEGSWPKKPDNRSSSLSGKMIEYTEISPRVFQKGNEVSAQGNGFWQKQALNHSGQTWEVPTGRSWEEARWSQVKTWDGGTAAHHDYQPSMNAETNRILAYPDFTGTNVGWSSRLSPLGIERDGQARMYHGRLTRVRQQTWGEDLSARDLGKGKKQMFTPEDVDRILSQPLESPAREVKGQSSGEFPHEAGGN